MNFAFEIGSTNIVEEDLRPDSSGENESDVELGASQENAEEKPSGLEIVYLQNREKFARFLQKNGTGSHTDDLLQEMWIRIRRTSSGPLDDAVSYLYRMAHNMMLDHHRGDARSGRRDHEWSECNGPSVEGVSDEPSAERLLIARETWGSAEAHLHRIGEPTSRIFLLHRLEGKTQRAIAVELRMGLSTVEKHLRKAYRAMLALKDVLDEA